jgi:anti-sigma B factor antagonist
MKTQPTPWWLNVEQIGNATALRFAPGTPLDEEAGYIFGDYVGNLVEARQGCCLVINFDTINYLDSMMLGKLFALNRKLKAVDGKLVLCGIHDHLVHLFELVKLPLLVPIYDSEEEALRALGTVRSCPVVASVLSNGTNGHATTTAPKVEPKWRGNGSGGGLFPGTSTRANKRPFTPWNGRAKPTL